VDVGRGRKGVHKEGLSYESKEDRNDRQRVCGALDNGVSDDGLGKPRARGGDAHPPADRRRGHFCKPLRVRRFASGRGGGRVGR